MPSKI